MARIALDIDSTLHHYWDLLERIARERYGVELPYEEQRDWGITALERDALVHCVEETHSDENIAAAEPYPGAVETVRAWHEAGHWIHVTSHRRDSAHAATARWLEPIGMPYDDLHCSFDKVTRCVELEHRRADRRQPGEHHARPREGHPGGHDHPPLERGADRRGRRDRRARTGASCASGSSRALLEAQPA